LGEASSPGKLTVDPGTTLLQAFAQMGGFTPFAATSRLQLRRTDPVTGRETVYSINYEAIESGTSRNGVATLLDGDVIIVPQRRLFE
jgi:polysaccharide export outer membrane protein